MKMFHKIMTEERQKEAEALYKRSIKAWAKALLETPDEDIRVEKVSMRGERFSYNPCTTKNEITFHVRPGSMITITEEG